MEEATVSIGGHDITLLGTIAGFVPEAAAVIEALDRLSPQRLALGVPPEDMAGLRLLADSEDPAALMPEPGAAPPGPADSLGSMHLGDITHPVAAKPPEDDEPGGFAGLDHLQEHLLGLLGAYGEVRLPSPDLDAAFRWALEHDTPVEAIDMDDETHTAAFVQANRFFDVIKANRLHKRLEKETFDGVDDAHELVRSFDAYQNRLPSLRKVEAAREEHMAGRLRELAKDGPLVAVVPLARMLGVRERLE